MKRGPYRDKKFLQFIHQNQYGGVCCICQQRAWSELHHFGMDGGMSLKPGDNMVARLCHECHVKYGWKYRALLRNEPSVLITMMVDALFLNQEWIKQLSGKEEEKTDCYVEELGRWLLEECDSSDFRKRNDWLLRWANRRASALFSHLVDDEGAK